MAQRDERAGQPAQGGAGDGGGAGAGEFPAPSEGLAVAHFLTVREVARSRRFYSEVLGGRVVLEENPCTVRLANSWIIMNPGGGPTPDKPGVTLRPPEEPDTVSAFLNLRVADIHAAYREWSAKGAEFLTPPLDRRAELRCYLRDPDGYLIEVGQATGLLRGLFARADAT
ncbi:VOC family protein [Streptomyces hoynatensis]|uniref:VOC family protein n=1 Tax=Streptomyces hoynatensis TaxID=1141874 RepID=A0A3A9YWE3_9ACTN|nr:VOC family protein [Streptomyces hoynatensis]RKN40109.1 VOC family protein [Streptomyces hoynatensis]